MDRKDCLASAFQHLGRARDLLIEAQLPGGEVPPRGVLEEAARMTAEAHLELERLLSAPDPYADKALRPGLNFHEAAGDDHV